MKLLCSDFNFCAPFCGGHREGMLGMDFVIGAKFASEELQSIINRFRGADLPA
jgi:hypothetical protein